MLNWEGGGQPIPGSRCGQRLKGSWARPLGGVWSVSNAIENH